MAEHSTSTRMAKPANPLDSDWTAMYVVLLLIPIVFVAVACFANWQDRKVKAATDIEAVNATYEQYWFSWRKTVADGERGHLPERPPVLPPVPPMALATMEEAQKLGRPSFSAYARPQMSPRAPAITVTPTAATPAWGKHTRSNDSRDMHETVYPQQARGHSPWSKDDGKVPFDDVAWS
ncbi:hypothetical protein JX265_003828 [Neoarthrinium moseri]|uniref:Uncharacterized protein n=1 Tax=Neoarthrinium moseri TaxID=1658444 RepID=A0A9P9WR98_9PEZI|nr:uncharacterized protein JN550_009392 [Neoarthrinium moseri]KAI1852404.1 hypothetical protein JX266_002582 [Neoarthrinium moseri]KAI1863692.1 hypothetical protein JN550_009392 [Neoarthrinium moseri]KAI1876302.1 hypothetical protein JX265_003828 [Neoarthrinium moseri]